MAEQTGAEDLVLAAANAGVQVCFANPGTTEMWVVDALAKNPSIRAVLALHETVCTGAADGYGRMLRKPALTLLHLGPGLANGISQLHNARRARTPMVNLIGDMATWHTEADPVLASDIEALSRTSHPRGKAALYLGGEALLQPGLMAAGKIAVASGAVLICENSFARIDRGEGLPHVQRLPYFPQEAAKELAKFSMLIAVDARLPVAMFGYKDGPSHLVNLPDDAVWELDSGPFTITGTLEKLAQAVGVSGVQPGVNCGGVFSAMSRPSVPSGRLTAAALCIALAALQPPDAIIVDESLTSGGAYWEASKGVPCFSHLTLTGGAIGCGPPLAVGAAIACPERIVLNLQADGSAMYSLQAFWTQARENLRVITIICANRTYAILKVELSRQKIGNHNSATTRSLTSIGQPDLDWVCLAKGMGISHASRATSIEELKQQLAAALERSGPSLIEALLV
ncbi:hypothetical protein WJX72_004533 [[Myrmecia] bisecta]|uniref:Uncharacterized protein n=1 Tax=[Myrmecia] bisecta TaxID=41462 RepID=A0AAW1PD48_9CHLO